jgi:ribosomal protein S18 acetylase RimI-like enzyme
MPSTAGKAGKLTVLPATPARWPDLEAVFAGKGCSQARGCWCMAYRRSGAQKFPAGMSRGAANRAELKALVDSKKTPGLVAYDGATPVGWIAVGPREDYAVLQRSPVMKPVDDRPVWSIVCFVVPSEYRHRGVAHAMLRAAIAYARDQGATLIEAYPVDKRGTSSDETLWFGTKSMYDRAGFKEVARRKPARPVVRRKLR